MSHGESQRASMGMTYQKKANVYLFLRFAGSTEAGLINEETKNFSVLLNISSSS